MQSAGAWARFTLLLAVMLVLSACDAIRFWEKNETPVETSSPVEREVMDVRNKATIIQSSIASLERRKVPSFSIGDSTYDVNLYSEGGMLRLIDERINDVSGSTMRNRYYFDDGSFFHFFGRGALRLNPGMDPPDNADVVTRMYFNKKGNLFHSEKMINELATELESQELPSVMRRAFALRSLDWSDSSGVINTMAFLDVLYTADDLPEGQEMSSTYSEGDPTDTEFNVESAPEGSMTAEVTSVDETPSAPQQANKPASKAAKQKPQARTQAKPAAQKPQPAAQKPQPTAQKSQPTAQKSQPVAQKPQPAAQKPRPAAQKPRPAAQRPQPAAQSPDSPPPAPVPADEVLISPHTHTMLPGTLSSHRIRFQKGSSGAKLSASVRKGRHKEYVLRARRGQTMSVTLQTDDPNTYFRVFLSDGDISGQRRSWSGSLPRYADYHIVVYVRSEAAGNTEAAYTVSMSIQ